MLTALSLLLLAAPLHPAHAGARKEASDAAKEAVKAANDRGPAASAAEIPALNKLLEKAGWTPTPELSGVFRPGSIFAVTAYSHALLAEGCIAKEPQENTYTSAEMVSSMQAGVSVRAGLGRAGVSGGIVKKIKFSTPVHLSVPILDLQLSSDCFSRLQALPAAQRSQAYVVREVLRAEIAEQTCGRLDAQGRMVGLGAAEAELSASCMQASLEPVGVGYRTVPLDELMAMGPVAEPAAAPAAVAPSTAANGAAPPPPPEAAPAPSGPFAIVFTEKQGSCEWSIEDLPTGASESLFASSACPSELVWDGGDELYYRDGDAFYMLRAGQLGAQVVSRPDDPYCGVGEEHRYPSEDQHWGEPRLDAGTGGIRWACWGESETFEMREVVRDGKRVEVYRNCIGSACVDDESPISSFGVPTTIKDYALAADQTWSHADTYADCDQAGDCGRVMMGAFGPLAAPSEPVGSSTSKGIVEKMLESQSFEGWHAMPDALKNDPSLNALLRAGDQYIDDYSTRELFGRPVADVGFAFWTRFWPVPGEMGGYPEGPLVVCDATCRRRVPIEVDPQKSLQVQVAGDFVVAGPTPDGGSVLVDVGALAEVRRWSGQQQVLVLPEGTATPFSILPRATP